MKCKFCKGKCVKYGVQKDGTQRYKCKKCGKTQQGDYKYKAYDTDIDNQIVLLTKEGVSIRGLGRCLGVSVSTVLVRIKKIADGVEIPRIKPHREYEVDEMWTFLGNKHKPLWIGYALDRKSKEVVAFNVGGRSIEMLSTIFKTVNSSAPSKVYTDYLVHYLSLVPCEVHVRGKRGTTHIERHNLNLRTHLKRLNRKTICFTRSAVILYAILKIYFWG